MPSPLARVVAVGLIACALLLAACSKTSEVSMLTAEETATGQPAPAAADPTATPSPAVAATPSPEPTVVDPEPTAATVSLDETFTAFDVDRARAGLELARATWRTEGFDHHVLRVAASCECDGWSVESLVLDATPRWTGSTRGPLPEGAAFPRSVDDVFDRADALVAALEADPRRIPEDECDAGNFTLRFDPTSGAPELVSDNTPCDGGVGWQVSLEPIDRTGHPRSGESFGTLVDASNLRDISLAEGIPGIVIDRAHDFGPVEASDNPADRQATWTIIGEPCQHADDENLCWGEIRNLLATTEAHLVEPCEMCPWVRYPIVAGTTFGTAEPVESIDAILEIIGTVDTPIEAALVAGRFGQVEPVDAGFEIRTREIVLGCDPVVDRLATHQVLANGFMFQVGATYHVEWGVCI